MAAYDKPLPVPDADTAPFWEGCLAGRLVIQRCTECGAKRFPPSAFCPGCTSANVEWLPVSGKARLYSWIVVRHPIPRDIYAADVPYVVALVDLDEGGRMPTNLVEVDPDAVFAGMVLEVVFDRVTDAIALPKFRPIR
jgi:Predicted nucleic-acid-binding protein containing a Zn-ribbon